MQPNLNNKIAELIAQGKSTEEIYSALIAQGYQVQDIQKAFNELNNIKETNQTKHERQKINIVQIVTYIGAILIGLGIFSFVAANWTGMASSIKILTLLMLMTLSYAAAFLSESNNMQKTAGAFYLLGSLVFGASIFLIGQIFNIRGNWAEGFIYWMLGILPLAIITSRPTIWGIAIITGLVGAAGYPFGFNISWPFAQLQMYVSLPMLLLALTIPFLIAISLRNKVKQEYPEYF